jgi:hypothetical protein
VVGERRPRREVGEEVEDPLAGGVDGDAGGDRAHAAAILFANKRAISVQTDGNSVDVRSALVSIDTSLGIEYAVLREGTAPRGDVHEAGEHVAAELGAGSLVCVDCGFALSIQALEALPTCPTCGGARFRRASLFDQPTVDSDALEAPESDPDWLPAARELIEEPGSYLACEGADDKPRVFRLNEGWTRIGRSGAADIELDDATVSRRHALVVLTDEGELRALDDRSLNGLFVNGEQVEWAPLAEGDELEIGRYRLFVLEA